MESILWYLCSLVSCSIAVICLSQSLFFQLQFGQTMLWGVIFTTVDMNIMTVFMYKANQIRDVIERISNHRLGWVVKAFVECCVLLLVTSLVVLAKHPRFRMYDQSTDGVISALRSYCPTPITPDVDPKIKAICSSLPQEQNSRQGDRMWFYSVGAFSLYTFSVQRQLKLREDYGLFYMCIELTMNAVVEIPGPGGSILHWRLVLSTTFYCFILIFLRHLLRFCDERRRKGRNGNNEAANNANDDDDDRGNNGDPQQVALESSAWQLDLEQFRHREGGHDRGEGQRETVEQSHRSHLGSDDSRWRIVPKADDQHRTDPVYAESDYTASEDDEHWADVWEVDEHKASLERAKEKSNQVSTATAAAAAAALLDTVLGDEKPDVRITQPKIITKTSGKMTTSRRKRQEGTSEFSHEETLS